MVDVGDSPVIVAGLDIPAFNLEHLPFVLLLVHDSSDWSNGQLRQRVETNSSPEINIKINFSCPEFEGDFNGTIHCLSQWLKLKCLS